MRFNIIIIIILILLYLIIKELIKYKQQKSITKIKYKFLTKPIYDKNLKDETDNDILLEDNIYNKMFNNPSPWMLSRGIGFLDKNDYRLKNK